MKKQLGMANWWILAIVAVVLLGLVYGISHLWTSYIKDVDQKGYDRGKSTASKEFEERDNKALLDAIAERNAAQGKLDKALEINRATQAKDNENYRKNLKAAQDMYNRDIVALKSGALVLRDPGKTPAPISGVGKETGNEDRAAVCGPTTSGSGDDRLSTESSGLVLWIASEANRLRDKSNELIKIVIGDRRQINGAKSEPVALKLDASFNGN